MISYPLILPGPLAPSKANLKKFDAIGQFLSPFTGSGEEQRWQDQHWELDLEWPEMTWAQFAALDAWSGALHGKLGSFLWSPPLAASPRGLGTRAGSPVAVGSDASGSNLLHLMGMLPSQSGFLLPGDYLQAGGSAYILQSLAPQIGPRGSLDTSLNVTDGVLTLTLPLALSASQLSSLPNTPISFAGLTFASNLWLNGLSLTALTAANVIVSATAQGVLTFDVTEGDYSAGESTGNVSVAYPARLYQYINPNPLATDGGGNAVADIFPSLREAPLAGSPIVLTAPQGTWRLADNRRESPAIATKTFTFKMKCREAL